MSADARARLALTGARLLLALAAVMLTLSALNSGRHARIGASDTPREATSAPVASGAAGQRTRSSDAMLGRDLFHPSRVAASRPYRVGVAAESAVRPAAAPTVRLLGTVIRATGRSFALCQVGSDAARVVYPGETIGALRLVSVEQGRAVFTDAAGARIELLVPRSEGGRNDR
jgi:hypothetical protein